MSLFGVDRDAHAHHDATGAGTVPTPRTSAPPHDDEVLRARRLLIGLYWLLGMSLASWLARLPAVRASLDLTSAQLGSILLIGSVGSLMTVLSAGGIVVRWGSRRTLLTAAAGFCVSNVLLGLGPTLGNVGVLAAGVLLMSCSFALGNVPMNLQTVLIERRMRRTVVPQFHAAFSVGSVTGSALGALAAWAGVPLLVHFTVIGVVAFVWRVIAIPGAVLPGPAARPAVVEDASGRRGAGLRMALGAWRDRRTVLLGLIVMTASLSEGSANNWLAISVVDGLERTEAVAAAVFGVFVASMTVARLLGTVVIDRFGPVVVLAASGASGLCGLLLFGLAPSLTFAVLGVVAWGLGAGLVVPIGMAAVAADPLHAAGRVAVVSAFGSVASIAAPPLLGLAADAVGARHALLLITGALVTTIVLSRVVRRPAGAPGTHTVTTPGVSRGSVVREPAFAAAGA